MPIQNIDNYLMANRSQEASILRTSVENRIPAEQQFLTAEVQEKAERNLNRTGETERVLLTEDHFDAKKKSSNGYYYYKAKKKKRRKGSYEEVEKELMEAEGRNIDIKL